MEYRHTPVLLAEVTQQLQLHDGSIIVDCTLGGAGHAKRIAELIAPTGILVGIDQDDAALTAARDTLPLGQQAILLKGNFGELDDLLVQATIPYVDGLLFDLGVSPRPIRCRRPRFHVPGGRPPRYEDGPQSNIAAYRGRHHQHLQRIGAHVASFASTVRNGGPRASQHSS